MTETLINPEIVLLFQSVGEQHGKTLVNPAVQAMLDKERPRRGTLLEGGYKIVEPIDVKSGEADLYLAEKEGSLFAVKLYHRDNAVKPEVSEKLAAIESPYIAKAVMRSFFRGMPFEVLPYYRGGSLKGKRFTLAEIKEKILPQLNEALHTLHQNGILHKDVKPANLMQNEKGEAVLIDFGISSAFTGGATVRVTETGMTIDYSAPEVFRKLYLVESDYYALGITLYELFTGHTPYHHLSEDAIMQYLALQRIPFPDDMPSELRDLILALTYHDLTARHDTANPNRRWTYEEVKAWLQGEKQVIPGHAKGGLLADEIPPYTFKKQTYTTLTSLVRALGESWNEGKNELFYSRLSSYFENVNPILARRTRAIEEEAKKRTHSDDFLFWKLLHQLDPDLKILYFRGAVFASLAALGRDMLEKLKNKKKDQELWDALETAQAREVVKDKDGELDAIVEQGGVNFSGGQRQRLTIARALVRKPRILILDDSASALDYATDAMLRKSIRSMQSPPTTFIVSQRAASVRFADLIIVLDDGVMVGKGTHEQLLKENAVYQEVYYSQFPKEVTDHD